MNKLFTAMNIIENIDDVLYLRWNERHLGAYFETLMTLCKVEMVSIISDVLCDIYLVTKIC